MNLAAWRSTEPGAFTPEFDDVNDFTLQLKVFDTNNVQVSTRGGALCFTDIEVNRHVASEVVPPEIIHMEDNFTVDNFAGASILGSIRLNFNAGVMEYVPDNSDLELINADPGDTHNAVGNDMDNTPVPWDTANQLYRVRWSISAGSAGTPPDVIRLQVDSNNTQELIVINYISVLSFGDSGMPTTMPETLQMFFYSHNISNTQVFTKGFRPRLTLANKRGVGGEFDADNQTQVIRAHEVVSEKLAQPVGD
jgi:hypothetical protein